MKALEASKQLAGRDECLNSCAALLPISAEEYLAERDSAAFRSLLAEVSVPAPADAALWPVCAQNGHLRCGCRLLHARSCPIGGCMLVLAQAFICTLPCALWWVRGQSNTNAAVTPAMKGGKCADRCTWSRNACSPAFWTAPHRFWPGAGGRTLCRIQGMVHAGGGNNTYFEERRPPPHATSGSKQCHVRSWRRPVSSPVWLQSSLFSRWETV